RNLRFDAAVDPYFTNPGGLPPPAFHQNATPESPSWAVYCDPIGVNSYSAASGTDLWVAGAQKIGGIARVTPSFIGTGAGVQQRLLTNCALLDDIVFHTNGQPADAYGTTPPPAGGI